MISAGNRPDNTLFPGDEVLSKYLPRYQWRTRASLHVNAGQVAAFDALIHANIRHPLVGAMLRLRGLRPRGSVRQFFVQYGFLILEEQRPLRLVVGLISRPWCWSGGAVDVKSREEWLQNRAPSHVKIVSIFGARMVDDRTTQLFTETRVWAECPETRWKFAAYWFVVKPFSQMIRCIWLREAKKRAEER